LFGIGGLELVIILVFAFLIFGPDKLPEIAGKVGKWLAKFNTAKDQMNSVVRQDMAEVQHAVNTTDEMPEEPFKKSLATFESITKNTAKSVKRESFADRKAAHVQERAAREAAAESDAAKQPEAPAAAQPEAPAAAQPEAPAAAQPEAPAAQPAIEEER